MPPRASATGAGGTRARGRGRGRGRGRPSRRDPAGDDVDDAEDVRGGSEGDAEEDSHNDNDDVDAVMRDRTEESDGSDGSDGSDYASSAEEADEAGDDDDDDDDDGTDASEADSVDSDAPRRKRTGAAARPKPRPRTAANSRADDSGPDDIAAAAAADHRIPTYTEAARVVRTSRGPYKRGDPPKYVSRTVYGRGVPLFHAMCERWAGILPAADPADAAGGVLASPWLPEHFEDDQIDALRRWYGSVSPGAPEHLRRPPSEYLPCADEPVYVLPAGSEEARVLRPGECIGLPAEGDPAAIQQLVSNLVGESKVCENRKDNTKDKDDKDDVYLLHAGGEVSALAWAPVGSPHLPQLLAIAARPHKKDEPEADVGVDDTERAERAERADVLDPQLQLLEDPGMGAGGRQPSPGSIQLWSTSLRDDGPPPFLASVVCFDWGWPKRIAWCPVPLVYDAQELSGAAASHVYGMLAVLADDGTVRVIEVKADASFSPGSSPSAPAFVRTPPIATLQIQNEPGAAATCLSWAGTREIVLGHADGSLTLWDIGPSSLSLSPPANGSGRMLLRIPAHDDCVLDVCSAYPSHPLLVASRPVQGVPRLVDLRRPATDHTYHPTPSVSFQPQLLAWSDHLQGFASAAVTNNPVNGRLDYFPLTHFPLPMLLVPHTRASLPTCLAAGAVHPFLAVGRSDGSVCVVNMMESMFRSARKNKIKATLNYVFNSEWRGAGGGGGGGGGSGSGHGVGSLAVRTLNTVSYKGVPLGLLGLATHAAPTAGDDTLLEDDDADADVDVDVDGEAEAEGEGEGAADVEAHGPSLMRIHDPLTRVSAVAWNPNLEHGTWCAIGLASGLVSLKKLAPQNI